MKMKKLVALVTAGVLCLGMSMTAFAATGDSNGNTNAPSPSPEEIKKEEEIKLNAGAPSFDEEDVWFVDNGLDYTIGVDYLAGADGLTDEQYKEVVDTISDPKKVEEVIKQVCNVPDGAQYAVLKAGDISYGEMVNGQWVEHTLPAGGVDIKVNVGSASLEGLKNGDSIYVLHYVNGKWEVLQGTVQVEGDAAFVTVHFNSLSPVAFVKVTSSGKVVPYDAKGNPVTPVKTKSPKTGEF